MIQPCFVCKATVHPRRVRTFDVYFNTVTEPICETCFTMDTSEPSVGIWADGPLVET